MTARYAVTATVIAEGAIVRLTKEAAPSLKDLMARWRVLSVVEDVVRVEDAEDLEDTRTFYLEELERVAGGAEVIIGYAEAKCTAPESFPYRPSPPEIEYPSLFDDPETLSDEDESEEDEDE